ncbi:MAG: methionine synthase [Spirochaetia bacterium]|nr:methionine synthase [Spirochaetia bacterium]
MPRFSEKEIREMFESRVLILDGAMGTNLQSQNLSDEDFGGADYAGCNEYLVITKPDAIAKVHRDFLEAGADIIETCSFGSTPLVLDEYGLGNRAEEISKKTAELARSAAGEFDRPGRTRLVAGSMGPTTKAITVTGGITFDELLENFYVQAKGLMEGGVDLFLVETAQDTLNLKAALLGILKLRRESGIVIPYMISGTIEPMGTMLAGQGVESMVTSLEHFMPLSFGINCATGPQQMVDHIRSLDSMAPTYISCFPNAGLPDEDGNYNESPDQLAAALEKFCDNGWLNVVGGCCGTRPGHIKAIHDMAENKKPHKPKGDNRTRVSGVDFLVVEEEGRPYLVGERTNSLGSRAFKRMIAEGLHNEAAEVGRRQVRGGAHIIDICLQNPDRDERADMEAFLPLMLKKIRVPVMVDSTDLEVLKLSLKHIQGKALYNSINLENGEDRFEEIAPLYHDYGFAVVVGCIDDDPNQGMGVSVERKIEIAKKSYNLLVNKYGVKPEDIIFDALVFPIGTGDEQYIGSAEQTVKGIEAIKKELPKCKTILGISNVSFGLPQAGREILNSVFLYHNVKAGLDYAIVNTEKLMRYPSIPENERALAEAMLFHTKAEYEKALADFAAYFKDKKEAKPEASDRSKLSVDERLSLCILEGSIDGLIDDLNEKMKTAPPLEIINGPLMGGMAEVGRLFNDNQLIVAEVLQSAEAMKTAVSHLEKFMTKGETSVRGKMLLATVKGDVHDIGKNLVEIILSNNGYQVVNMGIKVPPQDLISACKEHDPDMIGLSGLLVKSAEQMIITASDLKDADIDVPIFVGGAALSEQFTRNKIRPKYDGAVIYARDAMEGLSLVNELMDESTRSEMIEKWKKGMEGVSSGGSKQPTEPVQRKIFTYDYGQNGKPDLPPDLKSHRLKDQNPEDLFPLINPAMLYKKHLGYRGNTAEAEASSDPKYLELKKLIYDLQNELLEKGYMKTDGIYRFFRAASDGDDLVILDSDGKTEKTRFHFKRQTKGEGLCLSDYAAPLGSGIEDYVAVFIVTAGIGIREITEKWKEEGQYLKSHALSALALESAEAFAEYLHSQIRRQWGFPDAEELTPKEMFSKKYRGGRFSFGYPACPNLSDQEPLFKLMNLPEDFGVKLTDGFSMDPEASVSAIVFQHPEAKYFSVE